MSNDNILKDIGPLTWNVPITDRDGRPTPEFQRRWAQQRANNSFIGSVTLGSGAPTGTPADGAEYIDTSVDPYVLYVGDGGTWHQVSARIFLDLADVPNSYTAGYIVAVNATADGLEFKSRSSYTANPTAIASDVAVNGSADTFMRSDAAPAVQKGSNTQFGIVKVDGTTITATGGVISGATPVTSANPTATASNVAVNGVATTYMRSDAAPAIQLGSSSQFGVLKVDGTTITASSGIISTPGGANPTATASDTAVNGSATTFMRSDAAPAIQKGSSSVFGIVKVDGTTITASGGVISSSGGATGANPTATASDTAVNGSASTFMRSDAAPAIQKASSSQFGLVKVDGTTITASSGVISAAGGGSSSVVRMTETIAFGASSSSNFCCRGFLFTPHTDFYITAVWGKVMSVISGSTYKGIIAPLTSNSFTGNTTSGSATFTPSFTPASSLTGGNFRFEFSSPVLVSANTSYMVGCIVTSGLGTDSLSWSNAGEWIPTMPIKAADSTYRVDIASTTVPSGTSLNNNASISKNCIAVEWKYS